MKTMMLLTLCIGLAGCATTPMKTASGRPEITITGQTPERVRAVVVNYFVNQGWMPKQTDMLNLTFERQGDLAMAIFLGSRYDPIVFWRLRVMILDQADGSVRVLGTPHTVANRGSAFEREAHLDGGQAYVDMQTHLMAIQQTIEMQAPVSAKAQ